MITSLHHYDHSNLEIDEPNLIPLLDFMLVLLVMFVLLAGPIQHLLKLPLPDVKGSAVTEAKVVNTILFLEGKNNYRINGRHFTTIETLQQYLQEQKSLELTLAADKNIPLQTMLQVFAMMKTMGLKAANIQVSY